MKPIVNHLLECLLRGKRNAIDYNINMCANDIDNLYRNDNKLLVYESKIDYLFNLTLSTYGITLEQLKGECRKTECAKARHAIMYTMRILKIASLKTIGNLLGGRDHSTVINGVNKAQQLIDTQDELSIDIINIFNKFSEYISGDKYKITEETEIKPPKIAFPIEELKSIINTKIDSINSFKSADSEVMRSVNIERHSYQKILEEIENLIQD